MARLHILGFYQQVPDRPFNLGNLTMDWERRKWDLMVGIVGGKLQKKDDVFKVEGPF
ncbi:hypothetical protein WN944_027321 [Citrus x changshan-huyou]|uniref:Uncharacterized protein n=1 Tax=Citrus x changshan-huyou TaxID=2935761 RepID=A0AAP0LKM5_9ROSI